MRRWRAKEGAVAELRLAGITKRFGAKAAVRDLSLDVASGEFVVLLGPSGAGKTTTLRLVAGLETPDTGHVHIAGRDVTRLAPALRNVAFVFQQYSLYPHLSVYDNLAFPLRSPLHFMAENEVRRKVEAVATLLRIDDKLRSPATRLSGGQMQRVAIGRALVREPALYLMDEPLSSLDAKLRNDLRLELKRIQQDLGATMLYVTHDQVEALTMATRIGVLEEGRIVQLGTPEEIYEDPVSSYVAARLGSPRINLLPRGLVADVVAPDGTATVGIRAEHVRLRRPSPNDQQRSARVKRVEQLSDQHLIHVALCDSDREVVSAATADATWIAGDAVHVDMIRPFWFDADGQRIAA